MKRRKLEIFESHEAADAADAAYYASLTPQERLDLVLELSADFPEDEDEADEGRQRVYRVVELDLR